METRSEVHHSPRHHAAHQPPRGLPDRSVAGSTEPGRRCLDDRHDAGRGGSRTLTYKQILDAFFPMGLSVGCQVDKELITFTAEVHADHLEEFYEIFRGMLLDPGWRADDFARLTDDAVNMLEVELRGQNDEELAKEILYQRIYQGHPYERHDAGTVSSLQALALDQLKAFYLAEFASSNLIIAIGGGYPDGFEQRLRKDFSALPLRARCRRRDSACAASR